VPKGRRRLFWKAYSSAAAAKPNASTLSPAASAETATESTLKPARKQENSGVEPRKREGCAWTADAPCELRSSSTCATPRTSPNAPTCVLSPSPCGQKISEGLQGRNSPVRQPGEAPARCMLAPGRTTPPLSWVLPRSFRTAYLHQPMSAERIERHVRHLDGKFNAASPFVPVGDTKQRARERYRTHVNAQLQHTVRCKQHQRGTTERTTHCRQHRSLARLHLLRL
jgi:hypothetical protein